MRTNKHIQLIALILITLTSIFITGCGNDVTSTNTTMHHDCSTHHTVTYGPYHYTDYTNTFVETGNVRVFQISAFPLSSIGNLCTHTEPYATATGSWETNPPHDTAYAFSVRVVVNVDGFLTPYSSNGTIVPTTSGFAWSGNVYAGLEQSYGAGPGTIYDLRVDVRFRSTGNLNQDMGLLGLRGFNCGMVLQYDEFLATDHMSTIKKENEMSGIFDRQIFQPKNNGAAVVNYPYTF